MVSRSSPALGKNPHRLRQSLRRLHAGKQYVVQALLAGASGYLAKDTAPPELRLTIDAVIRGETYLSRDISRRAVSSYLAVRPVDYLRPVV